MSLTLYKKAAFAFAASLTTLTMVGVMSIYGARSTAKAANARLETVQTLTTLDLIFSRIVDAEMGERGFIMTGDKSYLEPYLVAQSQLPADLKILDDLIDDTSVQQQKFNRLAPLINSEFGELQRALQLNEQGLLNRRTRPETLEMSKNKIAAIRLAFNDLKSDELAFMRSQISDFEDKSRYSQWIVIAGSLFAFFTVAIAGWVTVSDIRRRLQLERELISARERAEQAAVTKAAFLANMSHEIRTPMNGVIGMTDILLDSELSHDQRDIATTIRTSADSLLTILNDVLDFSKMEAGKLSIETASINVRDNIESCIELLASQANSKGIELVAIFDRAVPSMIMADSGRLRQVLTNLIGNAIKFTTHGEVIVRVTCVKASKHQVQLRFGVKDTGIGIHPDIQQKLFKPFTQADNSTMRKFGGTGLGLAISKQIVHLMRGEIGVVSNEGDGSEFWFTAGFIASESANAKPHPALAKLECHKVLLIDQSDGNLESLHGQFLSWKMEPVVARSKKEAIALTYIANKQGRPFDFLLCDSGVWEADDVGLLKTLEAMIGLKKMPKIVVMSGTVQIKKDHSKIMGVDGVITKPVKQLPMLNLLAVLVATEIPLEKNFSAQTNISFSGKVVLLAEDNPINQKIALNQLAKLGYHADAVSNGKEALDALRKKNYDLILMDCQMPEMDGYEATQALRIMEADGRRTPVIAMTAHALQGDREKCIRAGMDDYISKPVKTEALNNIIRRLIA